MESGAFDEALFSNGFSIDIKKVYKNRGAITFLQLKPGFVLMNTRNHNYYFFKRQVLPMGRKVVPILFAMKMNLLPKLQQG